MANQVDDDDPLNTKKTEENDMNLPGQNFIV